MKPRNHNHLRTTVKNLRRDLHATREAVKYQRRVIADLRKQLSDLNAAKESELDKVINRLRQVATALRDASAQQRERITNTVYGTPRI